MFDEKQLWKERFGRTFKEISRYSRYIFNGHNVIVMVFLIGMGAYSYQEWLKTIPEHFPAATIMAIVLGFLLTFSPIYTFLTNADKIFLLPLEIRLSGYFNRSLMISFIIQAYFIFMGLGVFMPMYASLNNGNFQMFFPFLLAMIIVKLLNLFIRWKVQYYVETAIHLVDSVIRYAVNTVFLFLLFSNTSMLFLLPELILLFILFLFYHNKTKAKGLKWVFLIEQEERRMNSFYRFANLFTDVPKLRDRVKRRKWLDWLFARLAFAQENTFSHLYVRTFSRVGDYFGLFIRLTIIGAALIYFISFGAAQVLVAILFIYLTGFQLVPLWKHHQNKLWIDLYPLEETLREKSFKKFLKRLLFIQACLFAIPLIVKLEFVLAAITVIAGIGFTIYFTDSYLRKKLQG